MTIMKIKILSLTTIVTLISGASLLAVTSPQTTAVQGSPTVQLETVQFSNSAEADMLHRAYRILAWGDHDYHGHRAAAMKQVKQAADLLGLDLTGDDKHREMQVLSDDQLRNARDLLIHVRDSSYVKGQDRISRHVQSAIDQINKALETH
jgi:hypothetical protein